jgi:hypothetical protein
MTRHSGWTGSPSLGTTSDFGFAAVADFNGDDNPDIAATDYGKDAEKTIS